MPKSRESSRFRQNVFINCPFDEDYFPLLRPLLFTVLCLGFTPRIASERFDSGEPRISKICELIQESRFSIHDLSRLRAKAENEVYRLNMPFELGVEYGCRHFATGRLREKRCLILGSGPHDYQKALSDLAGVDIKTHDDDPSKVVRCTRDWLVATAHLRGIGGSSAIWQTFTLFASDFFGRRSNEGFSEVDLNMMPIPEYIEFIKEWMGLESRETL